jgi:hypothetical protein
MSKKAVNASNCFALRHRKNAGRIEKTGDEEIDWVSTGVAVFNRDFKPVFANRCKLAKFNPRLQTAAPMKQKI